ncbi:MAG: type IX secretion system membrane protein PorP/SprF [Mangrovibacterium sp.]
MGRKLFLAIILCVCCLVAKAQQDPQFTFYRQADLLYNPATAGGDGEVSAVFLNRNQWSSIEGAPASMLFSVDLPISNLVENMGVGLNFLQDELGFENTTLVNLNFSYELMKTWGRMGFGLSLGMFNKEISGEWSVPDGSDHSASDDLLPEGDVSEVAFDMGIGFWLKTKEAQLSVGITHLNQAEIEVNDASYTFYKRHFYLSGSYSLRPNDEMFVLEPSFMFKSDFSGSQLDLNADVHYKDKFVAGLGYRLNDGLIFRLSTQLKNGFSVGYAYDLTTSALAAYSGGSHEFFVAYSFAIQKPKTKAYKSVRYL